MVKFRNATENDAKEILDFINELAEYEGLAGKVIAKECDIVTNIFNSNANIHVIFAEINGERVGFALYFYTFSTFLGKCGIYIEDLYVKPQFRNQKVGKKLFQHIAQIAVSNNCERIELSCLNWNVNSIKFYESIGMKQMNEWSVHRLELQNIEKLAKCEF
jgi:GNAT superfamily N-acetyltransferase